jgi:mono/diheme cytochrome c family protein
MPLPSRISTTSTGLLHASFAFLLLLTTTASQGQADKALYDKGKKVFTGNCASCHKPDAKLTGPMLKGAKAKWGDKGDIYSWVKNSQAYLKTGNVMATAIWAEFKPSIMTPNAVSNEEIDAVFYYADNYVKPPSKGPDIAKDGPQGPRVQTGYWQWLIIVVLLLLVVVLSLGGVKNQLLNATRERDGKEPVPMRSIWGNIMHWAGNNKSWASVFGLFIFCWLIVLAWNWAFNIGVYGGEDVAHYKPEQPIAFNHKLHAGKMAINCQYCHSSAEKSKHAGIPSANVCMNCHKAVSEGSTTGKDEIAKIYEAVGWDPVALKYTGKEDPIKWVKVHNLPDHVAFSHQVHVSIGKIECQKCHGPVDTEFTVAEQWAPLTMGWCIHCHNETEVPQMAASAAGTNGYYDEIHRRLTETPMGNRELQKYLEDEKITVRELGGWECAKCHY